MSLDIVAVLVVRNERHYISFCLQHLASQGVETIVVDHESSDETREIAESFVGRGVRRVMTMPYEGEFDLTKQCKMKEKIIMSEGADWYIHVDADEIFESSNSKETIRDAIERIDATGANVINFDEFVFVPTSANERFEGKNYIEFMKHYYYFCPSQNHFMRAWKPQGKAFDLAASGGHRPLFDDMRIADERLVIRHYIILSYEQGMMKYRSRIYPRKEVEQLGWHQWRANVDDDTFQLPAPSDLCLYQPGLPWDKRNPKGRHIFVRAGT